MITTRRAGSRISAPRTRRRRRLGAAMIEFCFVLPFLVFILALVLYFGRGVVRVQRMQVMDRYEAWRQQAGAPGPKPDVPYGHIQLNQTFYAGHAQTVGWSSDGYFPGDAADQLIGKARDMAAATGDLAQDAIDEFPKGVTVRMSAAHDENVRLWKDLDRPIRHQHTRLGNDWRHANGWHKNAKGEWEPAGGGPWMLGPVRDVFLSDMDQQFGDLEQQDNHLAAAIRRVYLLRPGYVGPTIDMP